MKNTVILGVNLSHNSSAALMVNGEIKICTQEERFTNKKNFFGYPKKSIDYILKYTKKKKLEIDKIAFSSRHNVPFVFMVPYSHFFSIKDYQGFYGEEYYKKRFAGKSTKNYIKNFINDKRNNLDLYLNFKKYKKENQFYNVEEFKLDQINYIHNQTGVAKNRIIFLDHHTCHAHYAYFSYVKKYTDCAVVTLDSQGDFLNQTVWITRKDKKVLHKIRESKECDLARIYKMTTLLLSMRPDEHEFKVMGLAPYSKKNYALEVYNNVFKDLLKVVNCKVVHKKRPSDMYSYLKKKFEAYRFDNIAGGLQIFLEKITIELFKQIHKKTKKRNFALSGGVSMNIKNNKSICELNFVDKLFVPPSGSDESLAIGACFCVAKTKSKPLKNLYLGYDINDDDLNNLIEKRFKNKNFTIHKKVNHVKIAKLLAKNNIIAVVRGREEFGARALGNRSIIANPQNLDNKFTINEAIKNRDFWMPFALTILDEKQHQLIKNSKNIQCKHMTIGFETRNETYEKIKAGTHPYDKTVRPQILLKSDNENFYNIIHNFYKITKIPALLNTSFNLHGFPLSSNFNNIFNTFKNSGLKYLYINDQFLIEKNNFNISK